MATKVTKTHFSRDEKALCGSLVAKNLSTDTTTVDCANCVKLLPTLPVVVSVPPEESFSEKFDVEFPPVVYDENFFPPGYQPASDLSGDKGKRTNSSETITRMVTLSPFHIHRLADWNTRTQFPEESIEKLSRSILKNGLLVPLIVFLENGYYYLIDGERRLRAILWLCANGHPVQSVNCVVSKKVSNAERILAALITSSEKEPLPPIDEANAFQRLRNLQWDVKDIAERTDRKEAYINRHLKMLTLNPTLLRAVNEKAVSVTEVFKILKLAETGISQKEAAEKVLAEAEDGRTKAAKEEKIRQEQETKDKEALAKINIRREAKKLPPFATLAEAKLGDGPEIPAVSAEDKAIQAEADKANSEELQRLHADADTTPPMARGEFHIPPIELEDDATDLDGEGFEDEDLDLPHGTPPSITISPAVARSITADRKKPDPYLATTYGRLDVIMSSLYMDAPMDQPLPTMLMIMRWCVTRTKNPIEVMDACTQACEEFKRAQDKVIVPAKPLSPLGNIQVQTTVQLGKPGSAQADLDAMAPVSKV